MKRTDRHRGVCKKGEQIPSWLPKREQRVDASSCVEKEKVIVEEESLQDYERRRKDEKVENWKEKALQGAFVQQISDETGEESWRWLRNGFLKKEDRRFDFAAQEQALRTNSIKYSIDTTSETPLCRL